MESRELFWGISTHQLIMFYVIGTASMLIFLYGAYSHLAKYARGKALVGPLEFFDRLGRALRDIFTHRTLRRRDRLAGLAHKGIFYGYLFGAIATTLYFIEVDILQPLTGLTFIKGKFYLIMSLLLDVGHLALTCGLIYMIVRRGILKPKKLDYLRSYRGETELRSVAKGWRIEDWIFMVTLLIIEITGFLQEACGLIVDQPAWAIWSPVGLAVAKGLTAAGMTIETAASIRGMNWWMHGILALAFTAAIPWYKAKHVIAAVGSLFMRDRRPLALLPPEPTAAETAGISTIQDFTWKDMLHLDACTKCGRCHEACPARTAGYPLSPRDFILDLREYNDDAKGCPTSNIDLIGGVIAPETLWACRTCGACQEICPVGIEHPSLIVRMRRHLVEQGTMHPLLRNTITAIGDTGNSFGENSRKRSQWTRALEFRVKDIREEPAETLWFVGDYASFDPRNQKVSQTVARILKAAREDFALLHEGEKTAGNDVRRVGEEGLYEELAAHNIEQMTGAKPFTRIITTDPHSYNTIKNEYPAFGEIAPIEHYSSVLADLLASGRLKVKHPLNKRVTFHDPCHLGRLNGGYDAPRKVLELIGCELVEMPRNRDNSFCCGAGGGRIWIPDTPGTQKPSENRVHEAASLGGIDIFVTCCPKDLTMFEDARKTGGHEKDFVVQDLAELVAEAIELKSIKLEDLPPLADRIVKAIATQISDAVASKLDTVLSARLASLPAPAAQPQIAPPIVDPVAAVPPSAEPASATNVVELHPTIEAKAPAPEARAPVPASDAKLTAVSWDAVKPVTPATFPSYEAPPKSARRILVTIKHVAKLGDEYGFTDDGRDVRREFMEFGLNEWDDAALEEALRCVEKLGDGEVVAVCVGDADADTSLLKALAKGAHRAVRIWDPSLSNADPITISRAIAGIAKAEDPDLIFTGVQSGDQAHGATGTALARILGLPHAAVVVGFEWDGSGPLQLTRELEGGLRHSFDLKVPAVVAIQTGINTPRFATMKMVKQAKQKPLVVVDGAGVVDGSGGYLVRRMYVPERTKAEMLTGSPAEVAKFIANIIREKRGA
ncbi:MAG: heterodisulfide reductase-related iron-sulfur binding cluster [Hyphomicrobium sp.]|uniref:heterodisulfide reductase-related iron-sulfur binding cluster n=1 Tax=Hyphomicrobium sp. TaxID=82 RepID=UPI003D0C3570